jgi:hypothetical protein
MRTDGTDLEVNLRQDQHCIPVTRLAAAVPLLAESLWRSMNENKAKTP